jgi:parallel beta-helix repeat protein
MSGPAHLLRRLRQRCQHIAASFDCRLQKARPGSVLILVVALLVLLALMGTAFISTSRIDRSSSVQNTFNTEIDLLLQGVCQVVQQQILTNPGGPTDPTSTATQANPMTWTSLVDSPWLASRILGLSAKDNTTVVWPQISAPAIGNKFESPYLATPFGTATYGSPTANSNLQPTSIRIQTPLGSQMYPALVDNGGTIRLAASASNSGIADSGLVRIPIGELNGVTYYYSSFTIDNGSAVNASIAYQPNSAYQPTLANPPLPGDFFTTNVDLAGMLRPGSGQNAVSVSQQLAALNAYRWNGTQVSLTPVYDDGSSTGSALPNYTFASPFEAMWSQLGRRLDNPGFNLPGVSYQALPIGESMTLAHRYCLMNPAASPSLLESYLAPSVTTIDVAGAIPVRSTPYAPDQAQQFYTDNFVYDNGGGNLRALLVARNQTSSVSPTLFSNQGAWSSGTAYAFGNWVTGADGKTYVCIQDNPPIGPTPNNLTTQQYWVQQPWLDYPVKTSVNTASFGQLWLAYWNVMSANGADTPETVADPLFRNPIRASIAVSGTATGNSGGSGTPAPGGGTIWNVTPTGGNDTGNIQGIINGSAPGDTIAFAAGTYTISSTLSLKPNRIYNGGGSPSSVSGIAGLSLAQTLRLRAALAAWNTEQLRGDNSQILSRFISLGNITAVPTAIQGNTGGATLAWAAGDPGHDGPELATCYGGTTTEITGFTVTGCQIHLEGGTFNVHGNTFTNTHRGLWLVQNSGNYSNNTFTNTGQEGIWAYPGSNGTYSNNTCANNGNDGIHLFATSHINSIAVANNVITGCKRIGIEIQNVIQGLTVTSNYVGLSQPAAAGDSWMGLSIAVGNGNDISVAGNTIVSDKRKGAAVEIMGTNASITNNVSWGYGQFILNGGQGAQVIASGNKVYGGVYVVNDAVPWPIAPLMSPEAVMPPNAIAMPQPPAAATSAGTSSTTQPAPVVLSQSYRVMLYGTGQQPYITEVYANNDQGTQNGFVAVAIYNPYNTPITLKNWRLGTVNRSAGVSGLIVTALPQTTSDLSSLLPSTSSGAILPYQRLLFVSSSTMPSGITADPSVAATIVIPSLTSALNNELILLRPRRADGTLTTQTAMTDPNNVYDETAANTSPNALADFVPVDCYDFTNLGAPVQGNADSAEWHYVRPSDIASHNWYFVYPYTYDANTADNKTNNPPSDPSIPTSRLFATLVTSGAARFAGSPSPIALGHPGTVPADNTYASLGFPIQINNTDFGGPKGTLADGYAEAKQYPFGGFARNGDILQTTFIGAYRIDVINTTTDPTTGNPVTTTTMVEYNPVTMDAAFADDQDNADNNAENVGRFCPMSLADTKSTAYPAGKYDDYDSNYAPPGNTGPAVSASPYHFATRLFNYLTVGGPADDYMQNVGAESTAVPNRLGIANVKPKYINAYPIPNPAPSGNLTTEDAAPIDGLININTAPWPVLARLNMADTPADNIKLAKAIVHYRDVDRGDGTPHGAFKSIVELNGIATFASLGLPGFRTTLPTTMLDGFNPKGNDHGPSDGDLAPFVANANDQVPGDFEKQFLAFNRISNLITTRSDSFTTYVLVQGWRNAGTATPELVVQRRAAFISDRSASVPSNKVLNVTNVPVN